jgi:membrane protease YdiL (CAAX protease family)
VTLPYDHAATEPPPTGREVLVGVILVALILFGAFGALLYLTRGTDMPDERPFSFDFATAILVQNAGFLAAALPLLITRGGRAPAALGFLPARLRDFFIWGAVVVASALVLRQLVGVFQQVTNRPVQVPAYDIMNAGLADLGLPAMLLLAAVLAPLAEEVAFRGVLFSWLRRRLSFLPAAILQALPFGLLHIQLEHVLYATLLGAMLALARERGRSLWVPVAIHVVINTVAVSAIYLGIEAPAAE